MANKAQLNIRVRPDLKAELERRAEADQRTLSAYVEKVLSEIISKGKAK